MVAAMSDKRVIASLLSLVVVLLTLSTIVSSSSQEGLEDLVARKGGKHNHRGLFLLRKPRRVIKTKAGDLGLVSGYRWRGDPSPLQVGFINLEPNAIVLPQYMSSNIVMFLRQGQAKVAWMQKNDLVEQSLKSGDVSVIPAGSSFYIVNTHESERARVICSIDPSQALSIGSYQTYFIGGGLHQASVLSGFGINTLSAALNVSASELRKMSKRQTGEQIVYINSPEQRKNIQNLKSSKAAKKENERSSWSWKKLVKNVFGETSDESSKNEPSEIQAYNLYDSEPSFRNDYGWTTAIDENDFPALRSSDLGVYLVNLTGGSMLAPHFNPMATEYGVVLGGSGTIQVVFPNGTSAMKAKVSCGDVFWIPRYFPFCHIASESGSMEIFGFTTSSRKNRAQFLVGDNSVLQNMASPEVAQAYGMSEEQMRGLVQSQKYSAILPYSQSHDVELEKVKDMKVEEVVMIKRGLFA